MSFLQDMREKSAPVETSHILAENPKNGGKKREKTYFLTKAMQHLFVFCSLWKALTATGITKQFTMGMEKKNLMALRTVFVSFLSNIRRGSF